MSDRKPTHRLKVLRKTDNRFGVLGAGWLNEDGSMTVVLDPSTMITSDPQHVYTLFPIKPETPKK